MKFIDLYYLVTLLIFREQQTKKRYDETVGYDIKNADKF